LQFEHARQAARSEGLLTRAQWRAWRRTQRRPAEVPARPDVVYRNDGWVGWADWLGGDGGRVEWLSFVAARDVVRRERLRSYREWQRWKADGRRSRGVPANPARTYKEVWTGYADWLGYGGEGDGDVEGS
jgi:hypothetical protein